MRVSWQDAGTGILAFAATALALGLVAAPVGVVGNQLSRAIERRADHYALGLTGEPDKLVDFERRIAVKNVLDPRPPAWERLLATHPDTMERIGRALNSSSSAGW